MSVSVAKLPVRFFHATLFGLVIGALLGLVIQEGFRTAQAQTSWGSGPAAEDADETFTPVVTSTDNDGDGIPNAWETQFSHDPENSNDRNSDFDFDGLTTKQEYDLYTDTSGEYGNPLGKYAVTDIPRPSGFSSTNLTYSIIESASNGITLFRIYGIRNGETANTYTYLTYDPSTGTWLRIMSPADPVATYNISCTDVNSHGQVVGNYGSKGLLWTPDPTNPAGGSSERFFINPQATTPTSAIPVRLSDTGYTLYKTSSYGALNGANDRRMSLYFSAISYSSNYRFLDVNDYGEFLGTTSNYYTGEQNTFLAIPNGPVFFSELSFNLMAYLDQTIGSQDGIPDYDLIWDPTTIPDVDTYGLTWDKLPYPSGSPEYSTYEFDYGYDYYSGNTVLLRCEIATGAIEWQWGSPTDVDPPSNTWQVLAYASYMSSPAFLNDYGEFGGIYDYIYVAYDAESTFVDGSGVYFFDGQYKVTNQAFNIMGINNDPQMLLKVFNYDTWKLWADNVCAPMQTIVPTCYSYTNAKLCDNGLLVVQTSAASQTTDTALKVLTPDDDSDGDGMPDDWEAYYGFDPNDPSDAYDDPDDDGTDNLGEFLLRSNPNAAPVLDANGNEIDTRPGIDTDGDGMPNIWEVTHNLNYNDASDAPLDDDRDGFSNLQEFYLQTDPHGAPSYGFDEVFMPAGSPSSFLNSLTLCESDAPTTNGNVSLWANPATTSTCAPALWSSTMGAATTSTYYTAYTANPASTAYQSTFLVSSPSGATVGYRSTSTGYEFYLWQNAQDTSPTLISAAAANSAYLYNATLSPNGDYLVGKRRRKSDNQYDLVCFRFSDASVTTIPLTYSIDAYTVTLSYNALCHVNDYGDIATTGSESSLQRALLLHVDPSNNASPVSATRLASSYPSGWSKAKGISNTSSPVVGGEILISSGATRAAVWTGGTLKDISPLGGQNSYLDSVSPNGLVACRSDVLVDGVILQQVFIAKSPYSTFSRIPQGDPQPAGTSINLTAINAAGELIGTIANSSAGIPSTPTLWRHGKQFSLANAIPASSGYTLSSITQINSSGALLATGWKDGYQTRILLYPGRDTDGDGMPDSFEAANAFNPYAANYPTADTDSDGLSDLDEFRMGTDPRNPDSDADGMKDGWETNWGLNPTDPSDANLDPDNDRVTNLRESQIGTNPTGIYRLDVLPTQSNESFHTAGDDGSVILSTYSYSSGASTGADGSSIYESTQTSYFRLFSPPSTATPRQTTPLPESSQTYASSSGPAGYSSWQEMSYWTHRVEDFSTIHSMFEESPDDAGDTSSSYGSSYGDYLANVFSLAINPQYPTATIIPFEDILTNISNYDWSSGAETLSPYPSATSPNGNYRVYRNNNSAGQAFVIATDGSFSSPISNDYWSLVNNNGLAAGLASETITPDDGSPAYTAKRIDLSDGRSVSLPADWFPTTNYPYLTHLSDDDKITVRRQMRSPMGLTYYEFHLVDAATGSCTRIRTPGLGSEFIGQFANQNSRFLGTGPKPFQTTPDGTAIRLEALRTKTGPTAPEVPVSTLYPSYIYPYHITSEGTITLRAHNPATNQYQYLQLIPYNDQDNDGMADDWEIENGLDPTSNDSLADNDGDGIANKDDAYPNDFYNGIMPILSVSGNMQVKVTDQHGVPMTGAPLQLTRVTGDGSFTNSGGATSTLRNTGLDGLLTIDDYSSPEGDRIKVSIHSNNGTQSVWLPADVGGQMYGGGSGGGTLIYTPPTSPTLPPDPLSPETELVYKINNYLDVFLTLTQNDIGESGLWDNYNDPETPEDESSYDYRHRTVNENINYTSLHLTNQTSPAGTGEEYYYRDFYYLEEHDITETTTPVTFDFTDPEFASYYYIFNKLYVEHFYELYDTSVDDWRDYSYTNNNNTVNCSFKLSNTPQEHNTISVKINYLSTNLNQPDPQYTVESQDDLELSENTSTIHLETGNNSWMGVAVGPFLSTGAATPTDTNPELHDYSLTWEELDNEIINISFSKSKRLSVDFIKKLPINDTALCRFEVVGDNDFSVASGYHDEMPIQTSDTTTAYNIESGGNAVEIKYTGSNPNAEAVLRISLILSDDTTALFKDFDLRLVPDTVPAQVITATATNDIAASPRYRKIGLTGRPLSDEKPQSEDETDEENEETYVDAYTNELRHSTTDIYVPVPSSKLALSVRRNTVSEAWNYASGLSPSEDPTLAFGPAWRSNLSANIMFVEQVDGLGSLVALMGKEERKEKEVGQADPNYAFVTDEDGNTHRFAIGYGGTGGRYFVPMPTSRHEQDEYLVSLTYGAGGYIFTKKFGNTLTFSGSPQINFNLTANRITGSKQYQKYEYHRLLNVEDQFGTQVNYSYSAAANLVPSEISVAGRPDLSLRIVQDTSGMVTHVYDPNGNYISYEYAPFTYANIDPVLNSQTAFPVAANTLHKVKHNGTKVSQYGYSSAIEEDYRKYCTATMSILPWNRRQEGNHFQYEIPSGHIDVQSIQDAYDNSVSFTYDTNLRFQAYTSEPTYNNQDDIVGWYDGYYTLSGMPRTVRQITLQDLRHVTISSPNSPSAARTTTVTDAQGNSLSYSWTNPSVYTVLQDNLGYAYSDNQITTAKYTYLREMSISHSGIGTESYEFDISSGLALSKSTDLSGNITRFHHGQAFPGGATPPTVASEFSHVMGLGPLKYYEPTSQVDALNRTTHYEYGPQRVMTKVLDPANQKTDYQVDGYGRRRAEVVTNAAGDTLKHTTFHYDSASFPNFLTRSTLHNAGIFTSGDPSWVGELTTLYEPDANGRVAREATDMNHNHVIDVGDLISSYTYDRNGNKLSVTNPNGLTTWFRYDNRNQLIRVTNPDGTTKSFVYDKRGKKVLERDENGIATGYVYNARGYLVKTVRDMNGNLAADISAQFVSSILSGIDAGIDIADYTTYSHVGLPISHVDSRYYITRTVYDALGRPTEQWAPGPNKAPGYSPTDATTDLRTQLFYETSKNTGGSCFDVSGFKPTKIIDPRGYTSHFYYDDLYRPTTTLVQYEKGLPAKFAKSNKAYNHTTGVLTDETAYREAYDDTGVIVPGQTTRPAKVNHTEYDDLYRPTAIYEAYNTPVEGETRTYYTSTGLAHRSIRTLAYGEEAQTDTAYDAAGRPTEVMSPVVLLHGTNESARPTTTTTYTPTGKPHTVTDARGNTTTLNYDARDRQLQTIAPEVYDPEALAAYAPITTTSYDPAGNPISITDPRGYTTTTEYDAANRPWRVTMPEVFDSATRDFVQPQTTNHYDSAGNILRAEDPNGSITINTYDALGRLKTTKVNPDAVATDAAHPSDIITAFEYDHAGNKTKVTDGAGQVTAFDFDGLSRNTATHWDDGEPRAKTTTTEYDAALPVATVDSRNTRVDFAYDARFQLTGSTCIDYPEDNETREYDLAGRLTDVLTDTSGDPREVHYTYDSLDRMITETSAGALHSYGYDQVGNRTSVLYGSTGRHLTTAYDALNRVSTISDTPAGTTRASHTAYVYDLAGNALQRIQANGTEETCSYDALGRRRTQYTAASGYTISSFIYRHDLLGNLTDIHERYDSASLPDRKVHNTYDRTHRLLQERSTSGTSATVATYGYDKANNRTSLTKSASGSPTTTTAYTYGNSTNGYNSNQLKTLSRSVGDSPTTTTEYTYDANGNRETKTIDGTLAETYHWDSRNRLALLETDDGDYSYAYDYRMRRVTRNEPQGSAGVPPASTVLISFSGGTSAHETVGSAVKVEYIRGSDWGGGVGGVLYTVRSGKPSFCSYNGRGDVVARTNGSGNVTWEASYEAFGTRTAEHGETQDRQMANTKEEDPTGLLNEGFRYRDLESGIFLSRDPAGFVDGPNVYTYVNQNPWSAFDPEGLWGIGDSNGAFIDGLWNGGASYYRGEQGLVPGMHTKQRTVNGLKGGAAGAGSGAVVGAGVGAGVGALGAGVGAAPGAVAGATTGAIGGGVGGFIAGFTSDPNASTKEVLIKGGVTGVVAGATGGIAGGLTGPAAGGTGAIVKEVGEEVVSEVTGVPLDLADMAKVGSKSARNIAEEGFGVTQHGLQQKINREVRSADELQALKDPLKVGEVKIDSQGRPSQRYVGEKAETVINPETKKIVSVNPTSTKKAERLKRQKEDSE